MNKEETKLIPWHAQSVEDVFEAFSVTSEGLTQSEAESRLEEYGPNALPEKPPRAAYKIFLSQFAGPLMAILLVAGVISIILLERFDAGIIFAVVLLNAILGFFEEYKADRLIEKLKTFLPRSVKVRREGKIFSIDSKEIVPGEIMILSTGDKVTADGRIVDSGTLEINEAALTGESSAVKKSVNAVDSGAVTSDQKNMVFAGTVVVLGRAEVVVTGTGKDSEIGRISKLVSGLEDEETPLQHQLSVFAKVLSIAILVLALIVFIAGVLRGFEVTEMFKIAVAIAVSAVPEGLVVAVTVILAVGMQRILKQKALVRRLIAAETLGSVSVICTDKTGTLTTGEMIVQEVRMGTEEVQFTKTLTPKQNQLLQAILYTSSVIIEFDAKSQKEIFAGSATEIALLKFVLDFTSGKRVGVQLADLPFDPKNKYSAQLISSDSRVSLFVVGAPEVLLERADLSDAEKKNYIQVYEDMTSRGLRVLMIGQSTGVEASDDLKDSDVKDLEILGLLGLRDPLRKEARKTIEEARQAGLIPVMITGDHPETARLIAKEAGLRAEEQNVITGSELDEMTDEELYERVGSVSVFARVVPRHKLRIVQAWQYNGFPVAMVGDGVNDAPAMKASDIGVAVGSGTEVAKETADMVLLDNNFSTIVHAIKEGRIIFENIRKMIVYLLSDSFSEVILVLGALLIGLPLPILPAQILWINLITDGFPSIALTFEPAEKGIMKDPPRKKSEKILNREMKILIFIIGILTDIGLFAIYFFLLNKGYALDEVRTFIFAALGIDSLVYVFAVRKFRTSVFRSNPFENKFLVAGVSMGFVLLILPLTFTPLMTVFNFIQLSMFEWYMLVAIGFVQLLLIEAVKEVFNLKRKKETNGANLRMAQNVV
ncbi:MAG: HAD-IC family P-type ATPase [Candidatus Uhrbacteria bacterium]|nr:HAD-IC family P-type ATPase [Candidatus Uhrbacteria bacterium]